MTLFGWFPSNQDVINAVNAASTIVVAAGQDDRDQIIKSIAAQGTVTALQLTHIVNIQQGMVNLLQEIQSTQILVGQVLSNVEASLQRMEHQLQEISNSVLNIEKATLRPKVPILKTIGEEDMALVFTVSLEKPLKPDDTVKGELKVTIAGVDLPVIETTPTDQDLADPRFRGDDDAQVDLAYRFIDNKNNASPWTTATATLIDTFAPAAPGTLGLKTVAEEFDEPTTPPAETPTTPPVEEPTTPPVEEPTTPPTDTPVDG